MILRSYTITKLQTSSTGCFPVASFCVGVVHLIRGSTMIVARKSAPSGSWNEQLVVLARLTLPPLLLLLGWPGVVRTVNYYDGSESRSGNRRSKPNVHHLVNYGVLSTR
jgi:hypothetical protein